MSARKVLRIITILVFAGVVAVIYLLIFQPEQFRPFRAAGAAQKQSRIIVPQTYSTEEEPLNSAEYQARTGSMNALAALNEGEVLVSTLTSDLDGDLQDEQIIAFLSLLDLEGRINIAYIDNDRESGGYHRVWETPTLVTQPGTVSLFTQDILGDRSICLVITGMTGTGEHVLMAFRKSAAESAAESAGEQPPEFVKIADIHIDGSIVVQEQERTQAYQRGLTRGQSFTIAAYGRDVESANILDQVELIYSYNPQADRYEQSRLTRLPGSQVEQRRVREILSGGSGAFEQYVNGLWYYVSPQGTLDSRKYIYFDPPNRELIFYGDETQQIFIWQNSSATRNGLYVSSQNISVTTLRRFIDIELVSLDSIRVRVIEDVRLRILVDDSWDGTYRRASALNNYFSGPSEPSGSRNPRPRDGTGAEQRVTSYLDASYEGAPGKLVLSRDGSFELYAPDAPGQGVLRRGSYAFYHLDNQEILELRPGGLLGLARETYLVEHRNTAAEEDSPARDELVLQRVILSTRGIQEVYEAAITLTLN
jgi:hypothetical protein